MRMAVISWNTLPHYFAFGGETYKYNLSLSNEGSSKYFAGLNEPSYKLKEIDINSNYCVSLMAYNDMGDGPWSDCVNFTTTSGNFY